MEGEVKLAEYGKDLQNLTGLTPPSKEPILLCRLCAHLLTRSGEESGGSESINAAGWNWVHLQKPCGATSETVGSIIGKCLPPSILISLPEDKTPVVCMLCYRTLLDLMSFLEKIKKGQEKLTKLTEELAVPGKDIEIPMPRKRGRPRKGASISKSDTPKKDALEEPREKRQTRVPTKYGEETSTSLKIKQTVPEVAVFKDVEEKDNDKLRVEGPSLETGETENKTSEENTNNSENKADAEDENDNLDLGEDAHLDDVDPTFTKYSKPRKKRSRGRPQKPKTLLFKCDKCSKSYLHYASLVYHKLSAHEDKRDLKCEVCQKTFKHKALLANHMFTHSTNGSYKCDESSPMNITDESYCNSSFKTRSLLNNHKKRMHSVATEKEFTCEICGVQLTSRSSLKAHSRIHTGEKPFSCQYCDKRFNHKGNLNEHIRSHTLEKPYVCPEPNCQKGFTTSSQLRNHKLSHSGTKAFVCAECGKGFNILINLKIHSKRHKGEASEECNVCQKKFPERWSMMRHRRLHTGEKPYKCLVCDKSFSDPSNYTKHLKIHPNSSNSNSKVKQRSDVSSAAATGMSEGESTGVKGTTEINENDGDCVIATDKSVEKNGDENDDVAPVSQSLVQLLTPEALAALSQQNSAEGEANVIYLYQPTDIVSVSVVDDENAEMTTADGTRTIVGLDKMLAIENLDAGSSLALLSQDNSLSVEQHLIEQEDKQDSSSHCT